MSVAGYYFVMDFPALLEKNIEQEFKIDTTTYSLLYSMYSFPNMVFPLFSGLIINKIGKTNAMLLFNALVVIGMSIIIIGPALGVYWPMVIGRTIFGIGCETCNVI